MEKFNAAEELMQAILEASQRPGNGPQTGMTPRERQAYAEGVHAMAAFTTAVAGSLEQIVLARHPEELVLRMFVSTHAIMVRLAAKEADTLIPPGFE